jgi:hypothetical protein
VITTYDVDHGWGFIYVKDSSLDCSYFVDMDAARCTFSRSKLLRYATRARDEHCYMIAANGTTIGTYGPIPIYLNLGRKWQFQWQFILADVISPVIGMDLLQYHGYLMVTRNKYLFKLIEPDSEILYHGCHWRLDVQHKPNSFTNTFAEISDLTRPFVFGRGRLLRDAEHNPSATFGPPALIKPGCVDVNPLKRRRQNSM